MSKINLVIIGGFLGAGKTTSILAMARNLMREGKRVAIVTNDQGNELVDTNFLAKEGFPVLEVTGGCFCCNFDQLVSILNQLAAAQKPEIILAEPVGSCTDLIATIYRPLSIYYHDFIINPYSLVVDPRRVQEFCSDQSSSLFPGEVKYLFHKQLEEADIIVLNKIDLLSSIELDSVIKLLKQEFPKTEVITVSAKENRNLDKWLTFIKAKETNLDTNLEIDYQIYATAEEYMGWLNSSSFLTADQPFDLNDLVLTLMQDLQAKFKKENFEIAHVKVYAMSPHEWTKASITSLADQVDFSKRVENKTAEANLIINARVNTAPQLLETIVDSVLQETVRQKKVTLEDLKTECFKPGKPVPRHRITKS